MSLIRQAQQIEEAFFWGAAHLWSNVNFSTLLFAFGLIIASLIIYIVSQYEFKLVPNWLIRTITSFSLAGLTWYFRLDHAWGDRPIFLEMLTHGHFFRMSQPLTTVLYTAAYKIVMNWDWPPRNAIALVISFAAFGAVYILIRLLSHLSEKEALATSLLLVPSSLSVLFFGYVESTILALTFHLLYFLFIWEYIQSPKALWKPAFALGLAIASHGLSIYLTPSLFFIWWKKHHDIETLKEQRKQTLMAGIMFILPAILMIGIAYTNQNLIRGSLIGDSLGGANLRPFVPLSNPIPPYERYTLFSLAHMLDLFNLIFLISPIALIIPIFAFRYRKEILVTTWGTFLLISSLCGLLFAFLWNPDIGMFRDWDLFAPFLFPLLLLGGHVLGERILGIKVNRIFLYGCAILVAINAASFMQTFEPVKAWSPSIDALPLPEVQHQTDNLKWSDEFELLGFDISPDDSVSAGKSITVTLYFRGLRPIGVGFTHFLHLTDSTGALLDQDDHQPDLPTEYWPAGEIQTSTFVLDVPKDIKPSTEVYIRVGSYFWQTQERLTLIYKEEKIEDGILTLIKLPIRQSNEEESSP